MKSLFKSGARNLKNKFSKAKEEDEFPTPLGLRIGAAVDIDTLPLRMNADDLLIDLPEETLIIVAQGYVDLGDSTYAHRYYTTDDTMIQVLTVAGVEDQHVEELTLFVPFQSYYPDRTAANSALEHFNSTMAPNSRGYGLIRPKDMRNQWSSQNQYMKI